MAFVFNETLNELIEGAYQELNIKSEDRDLTPYQYDTATTLLNEITNNLRGLFPNIWRIKFLQKTFTKITYVANGYLEFAPEIFELGVIKLTYDGTTKILTRIPRNEYFSGDADAVDYPYGCFYQRDFTPRFYLYPEPLGDNNYTLDYVAYIMPEDWTDPTSYSDMLKEWLLPIKLKLAIRLSFQYPISSDNYNRLQSEYEMAIDNATRLDRQFGNGIKIKPASSYFNLEEEDYYSWL